MSKAVKMLMLISVMLLSACRKRNRFPVNCEQTIINISGVECVDCLLLAQQCIERVEHVVEATCDENNDQIAVLKIKHQGKFPRAQIQAALKSEGFSLKE